VSIAVGVAGGVEFRERDLMGRGGAKVSRTAGSADVKGADGREVCPVAVRAVGGAEI